MLADGATRSCARSSTTTRTANSFISRVAALTGRTSGPSRFYLPLKSVVPLPYTPPAWPTCLLLPNNTVPRPAHLPPERFPSSAPSHGSAKKPDTAGCNVALSAMNLDMPIRDARRIEVVCYGLPLWHSAHLAVDACQPPFSGRPTAPRHRDPARRCRAHSCQAQAGKLTPRSTLAGGAAWSCLGSRLAAAGTPKPPPSSAGSREPARHRANVGAGCHRTAAKAMLLANCPEWGCAAKVHALGARVDGIVPLRRENFEPLALREVGDTGWFSPAAFQTLCCSQGLAPHSLVQKAKDRLVGSGFGEGISVIPGSSGSAVIAREAAESSPRWTKAAAQSARASSVARSPRRELGGAAAEPSGGHSKGRWRRTNLAGAGRMHGEPSPSCTSRTLSIVLSRLRRRCAVTLLRKEGLRQTANDNSYLA